MVVLWEAREQPTQSARVTPASRADDSGLFRGYSPSEQPSDSEEKINHGKEEE